MSVLDAQALERLRKLGGDSLVRRMIDLFFSHAEAKMDAARANLQMENLEALERAVHSLKSSAGNLGANTLFQLAGKIESLATQKNTSAIRSLWQDLERAFSQVKAQLEIEKRELAE